MADAAGTFTFDLGGRFRGEDLEDQSFLAEVKNYKAEAAGPPNSLSRLLSQVLCRSFGSARPLRPFHMVFLGSLQAQKWDQHTTVSKVEAALLHQGEWRSRARYRQRRRS